MKIKVGSRDSKLAVIQTNIVIDCIKKYHPEIELELITMKTTGDMILDKTLDQIGGKGLFVKELDQALTEKSVDITVHSFKDVPLELSDELPIVAVSKREDPQDVLVLPQGIDNLDLTKPIGCASKRRTVQLKQLYPNCTIKPVRGNVITRLHKLDSGEYSALVLAKAGMKRLGLEQRISKIFDPEEMLPSNCQGILAVQARKDLNTYFLKEFNDETTFKIAKAERSFVKTLNGGCSSPVAAYGVVKGDEIILKGMYVNEKTEKIYMKTVIDKLENGELLGIKLAKSLQKEGNPNE